MNDEMGFLETVVKNLREATATLKADNDEAERKAEFERMLRIVDAQCDDARRRVREEATARNIRLGLAPDHGLISDDDRR